jgi:hypothetical protein
MTALMERTASTPEEWHAAITAVYQAGKAMFDDDKRPHVELTAEGDTLTLRQLRFIHGPILKQISEQVAVEGVRYTKEVWKRHLKELFIPDRFVMVQAPFVRDARTGHWRPSKRKVPRKVEKSLTQLTGRARSDFIDQVLAHAATEWGVEFVFTFDEREAVRYRPPLRKAQKATAERGEAMPA